MVDRALVECMESRTRDPVRRLAQLMGREKVLRMGGRLSSHLVRHSLVERLLSDNTGLYNMRLTVVCRRYQVVRDRRHLRGRRLRLRLLVYNKK